MSAESYGVPGSISYLLKSATDGGEEIFNVDVTSGDITVISNDIDADTVNQYILFIEAQDSSWSPARYKNTKLR